ncbi:MAG: hypothetical protein C4321_09610 [Chloroflexota bacterium]
MNAETSSVSAPIWKPNTGPNTLPASMMSKKIGDAPRNVGTKRSVALTATSTPSKATVLAGERCVRPSPSRATPMAIRHNPVITAKTSGASAA